MLLLFDRCWLRYLHVRYERAALRSVSVAGLS
jgi:hypothetical protein